MNHQLPLLPCSLEQMLLLAPMMQLVFGMTVGILKPTCIRANVKQFVPQSVLCIGVLCSCCIVLFFILVVSVTFHVLDMMTMKFRNYLSV